MSADKFNVILQALIERRPFYVFTIVLRDRRQFEIDHADAIIFRNGIAMFTAPGDIPIFFDHESVNFVVVAPSADVPNGPHQ